MDRFLKKFGLSSGTMEIRLEQQAFRLGDQVRGKLQFELKKPGEGRALWVEVRATQTVTLPRPVRVRRDDGWKNEVQSSTQTHTLYQFRSDLDGYHMYDIGTYDFCIPLPSQLSTTAPESDLGKAAELVQAVMSGVPVMRRPVKWHIEARLEIPWSLGLSEKKPLQILEGVDVIPGSPPLPKGRRNFCGGCGERRAKGDDFCPHCGRGF